jgi:hypothetical protein
MASPIELTSLHWFARLPRPARTSVLLVLVGLILLLALALDSGGETAFMYVTF